MNNELLTQLSRQSEQPNKQCTIKVHEIDDEDFVHCYGETRAVIHIIVPKSVVKEIKDKYHV